MGLWSSLHEYMISYTYFFGWRDALEIIFFSMVIYYFSVWLRHDKQKNLLGYFYSYCVVSFAAYYLQLTTVSFFMYTACPAVLLLFIVLHEKTLQKNFVALKSITPAHKAPDADWLTTFVRSALVAVNDNKTVRCVIERKDSLADVMISALRFNVQLDESLLTVLFKSNAYHDHRLLWIQKSGNLVGINCTIKRFEGLSDDGDDEWIKGAIAITHHMDALFFVMNHKTHLFDIVVEGKVVRDVQINNGIKLIRDCLDRVNERRDPSIRPPSPSASSDYSG